MEMDAWVRVAEGDVNAWSLFVWKSYGVNSQQQKGKTELIK